MLGVDDSQLTEQGRLFLQQWAKRLRVSAVLLGSIVAAAVEGERYNENMPNRVGARSPRGSLRKEG
jgi:hypothetical protein